MSQDDTAYDHSEKGKARRRRYAQSAARKAACQRYRQSAASKATKRRYEQSAKGRATIRRMDSKRVMVAGRKFRLPYDLVPVARAIARQRKSEYRAAHSGNERNH